MRIKRAEMALVAMILLTATIATAQSSIPPFPTGTSALQAVRTVWPVAYGAQATNAAQATQISALQTAVAGWGGATTAPTATSIAATATSPAATSTTAPTTATPLVQTVTPVATATMDHTGMGKCGEPMDRWHAPVYNGCATGYELGDEPPAWVWASPKKPLFDGMHATSAIENTTKHAFMKGYSFKDQAKSCIEIYVIQHGGSMGMERIARFHSTQFWIKDCFGAVSYGSMWTDFGANGLYPAGDRVEPANFDAVHQERANEGIMRVNRSPDPACEQWYGAAGGSKADISLLICNSVESYTNAETTNPNGEYDPSNWQLTGGLGLFRQLDFAWPLDRITSGIYQTDQFGRIVNSCTGNTTYDGTSYPVQCQAWVIQDSLRTSVAQKQPEFGIKRIFAVDLNTNYDGTGVVAPN